MRAAIIGTGLIAHNHAQALRQQGHVLSLVVSRRLVSARQFAGQYGCTVYADTLTADMLETVDAVHVCTPPGEHCPYVKMALEAGKAVFCEKPLTFDVKEAETLCRLAEEKGTLAAVNFNNRFYPACDTIRARLRGSGAVELVHGHYRQEFQMMPAPLVLALHGPLPGGDGDRLSLRGPDALPFRQRGGVLKRHVPYRAARPRGPGGYDGEWRRGGERARHQ